MVCCKSFHGWCFAAKHKKWMFFAANHTMIVVLLQIILKWMFCNKPFFVSNTMKNGLQKIMVRLMVCNKSYQI
jgi:hypothetical protein